MKEGRGSHADSLGNIAIVRPGGVQWMRTGSGIEHAEGGGNPPGVPPRRGMTAPQVQASTGSRYGSISEAGNGLKTPLVGCPVQFEEICRERCRSIDLKVQAEDGASILWDYPA